ncbi:DedA family protein [Leuconostoc citreum]|uniref:DedA family protein n=1 Tax=Leuconostoc citreum TaxID=33964 RepID=UPI0011BAECB0|nr:DedA family protein [Leuconostoc citreum]QEA45894.1 DedA family protein [Leuconostoc citreum]QEA62583.1 DedA family protein [Leuconostoc citreum]
MLILASNLPHFLTDILSADNPFSMTKLVILFLLIFIETAGIVTGFIPGDTILTTAGGLAGTHHNFGELMAYIAIFSLASFLGDAVNYWFGAFLMKQISKIPFLKRHLQGEMLDKLATNFHPKRWLLFVVLGRFLPFIRVVVPLLARRLGLPFVSYIRMSAFASVLWSAVIVSAGYFIGHLDIPSDMLLIIVVGIAIVFIVALRIPKFRQAIVNLFVRK